MSTSVAPPPAAPAEQPQPVGPEAFAAVLAESIEQRRGGTVTWFNHYSGLRALQAGVPVDRFDYLGLDGVFLCHLVRTEGCRTSADLVMPLLLERTQGLRIALIGSRSGTLSAVAEKITAEYGHQVVLVRDGYDELPEPAELRRQLGAARVQLAVVGLGAPKQDFYVLDAATPGVLVTTCGGWLDQFTAEAYYPAWAYPLRLNWLVRLAREPRRLWRRYTVDAARALRARAALTEYVTVRGRRPLDAAERPTGSASADAPAA
ncbi:WecB/TagA/CpsF family glycosyltransferase [Blastococcus sp. TF02A-30]|uniref:WecB/TagA/CpsF family glycosyltransferase n=1 Tax=Blastococcus sp. TF02A-30 TaxID=2250580 RepID=UPI000DE92092|nr:WecB/TagA/CpsF family glycosyltransferase [Blastococcus sp. TF02A-30]RBY89596.1 glycosyltransferase [Blastococcus sp. TF02A-30]